jgi:hypothetical protein
MAANASANSYAHVNIWHLNEAGASPDDTAAHEIGAALSGRPGFRSYTLVRTGQQEVVAVSVFDSQEQLEEAMHAIAPLVHKRVTPLATGGPERRQGEVLYHHGA